MLSHQKEGFTIDFVAKSDALGLYIYYLTAFSLLLHLTDFLNTRYNNNWTTDPGWDWNNEIVVITGGSSGIGAHLAQNLHSRNPNTKVIIIDYVPLTWEPLEGAYTKYYQCDLSNSSQIRLICEQIRAEVGHPTVLVNNAGICRGATVCDGSYADVEVTMRTNLIAPFLLVKEFGPEMVRRNHGHIINISSMSAFLPPAKVADYAATKAGLIALHEVSLRYICMAVLSTVLHS
ncbi:Retinol dehydrogenase 10-B [Fusarium oxysporum f. sp. cubense race 1]|uniref:Retinol dehydrogenase 10-B n=1 Tax=Fusarium oxysporum f. sp. cubense (strain race 1) TaxID=1229664 RepID=N4THK6_FUSC1|nr:Retinol dehydrogenase 10-B [Fusarium oxysporum f. sp. cubense race 1]